MAPNPVAGLTLHALGGLAAGSFYAPLKKVTGWSWETGWLVMGIAAWLVTPWLVAAVTTAELSNSLVVGWEEQRSAILLSAGFGMLWGIGNMTFGLSVRYLGMALGYAMALGSCMIFGTLLPPLLEGELGAKLSTPAGQIVLGGTMLCLLGVILCGVAGRRREREQSAAPHGTFAVQGRLARGCSVAVMAGLLSACFAIAIAKGNPLAKIAIEHGTLEIYSNNFVLAVILVGGFLTNAVWCLVLHIINRSAGDYVKRVPGLAKNYALAATAGVTWYLQFFFYGMGTTRLGPEYDFSSWSIHMAFIIAFSNLWGVVFREWKGVSAVTKWWQWLGIFVLLFSIIVIGLGNAVAT